MLEAFFVTSVMFFWPSQEAATRAKTGSGRSAAAGALCLVADHSRPDDVERLLDEAGQRAQKMEQGAAQAIEETAAVGRAGFLGERVVLRRFAAGGIGERHELRPKPARSQRALETRTAPQIVCNQALPCTAPSGREERRRSVGCLTTRANTATMRCCFALSPATVALRARYCQLGTPAQPDQKGERALVDCWGGSGVYGWSSAYIL